MLCIWPLVKKKVLRPSSVSECFNVEDLLPDLKRLRQQ